MKNSILLKSNRLVIPKLLRKRILDIAHQHHLGIVKTKRLLREKAIALAIDLQGPYPTGEYLIALINYRSRYPCVIQLAHVTTRNIITELDKEFKLFDYPRKLVTDRGQQFRLREFQQYLRQNDIKLRKTTPYSPWENGETERFNRCLKKINQCAHAVNKD